MAKLKVNKFILNDVRCFKGENTLNIRPLTFLVGKNSTGKSTVLGCFQAMADYLTEGARFSRGQSSIDFNSDPFQMGSFENIARRSSPKNKEFELGFEFINDKKTVSKFELLATFGKQTNSANPTIKKVHFIFDDGEIISRTTKTIKKNEKSEIKIEERNSKKIFTILLKEGEYASFFLMQIIYQYIYYYEFPLIRKEKLSSEQKQFIKFLKDKGVVQSLDSYFRCFPFAPTRSEPKRTYDLLSDTETSSGSEIPLILRNLIIKKPEHWRELREKLKDFGTTSDLFTDIEVKSFGGSLINPFQLELKIRKGAATNLIDVGYGVSQILPLLVRILRKKKHIFLMQQPEVHLHPQARRPSHHC